MRKDDRGKENFFSSVQISPDELEQADNNDARSLGPQDPGPEADRLEARLASPESFFIRKSPLGTDQGEDGRN